MYESLFGRPEMYEAFNLGLGELVDDVNGGATWLRHAGTKNVVHF